MSDKDLSSPREKKQSKLRPLPPFLENQGPGAAAAASPRAPPPPSAEELQASAYEALEGSLGVELKKIDRIFRHSDDKWNSLVRYFEKNKNVFERTYFERLLDILSGSTFLKDDAERYPLFKKYFSKGDELLNNGVYNFGILRGDIQKINDDFNKREYRQWQTDFDEGRYEKIKFIPAQ
jgi:hypothetical protein